jgi:hypothetical protein
MFKCSTLSWFIIYLTREIDFFLGITDTVTSQTLYLSEFSINVIIYIFMYFTHFRLNVSNLVKIWILYFVGISFLIINKYTFRSLKSNVGKTI